MMALTVAPCRRRRISITRACFESERFRLTRGLGALSAALLLRRAGARREGLLPAGLAPGSGPLASPASGRDPLSSTWIASRPCLVMHSSSGRFSSSRRQTGSASGAGTSSTRPSVRSLPRTLWAAPPFRFGASSLPRASRFETGDRSTSCVSVSFIGILHSVRDGQSRRHHRSPALAIKPAGYDPGGPMALLETVTLTLCLQHEP